MVYFISLNNNIIVWGCRVEGEIVYKLCLKIVAPKSWSGIHSELLNIARCNTSYNHGLKSEVNVYNPLKTKKVLAYVNMAHDGIKAATFALLVWRDALLNWANGPTLNMLKIGAHFRSLWYKKRVLMKLLMDFEIQIFVRLFLCT